MDIFGNPPNNGQRKPPTPPWMPGRRFTVAPRVARIAESAHRTIAAVAPDNLAESWCRRHVATDATAAAPISHSTSTASPTARVIRSTESGIGGRESRCTFFDERYALLLRGESGDAIGD